MYAILCFCLLIGTIVVSDKPLYLTPYIEEGLIGEAQSLANVTLKFVPYVTSYAGLFTVNKEYNSNIFFWYFVAQNDENSAPIIVWLNGGPGISSMLGLIQENGPFSVGDDLIPRKRKYSWHKDHHLIYIDNPVGVGYSFTKDKRGFAHNTFDCAENLHFALIQFFMLFPNLRTNDLYIVGESYGGKYAPAVGRIIHEKNVITNLKGIAIGNGVTDPVSIGSIRTEYLYQQGFIDDHGKEEFRIKGEICLQEFEAYMAGTSNNTAEDALQACLSISNPLHNPLYDNTLFKNLTGYSYQYNILFSYDYRIKDIENRETFMNLPSTRDAIHVGDLIRHQNESKVQNMLGISLLLPENEQVEYLLSNKVRFLVYTGELDICVPYIGTVNFLKKLDFPGKELYGVVKRNIWYVDEAVAGYWKQVGDLTEVMVVGAGHMVPADQPKRAYDLIYKFTHNKNIS